MYSRNKMENERFPLTDLRCPRNLKFDYFMLLSLSLQNAAKKCTRVLHDIFSDFMRIQLSTIPVGAAVNVNSLMPAKYALVINTHTIS